jgi:hypothetical protein
VEKIWTRGKDGTYSTSGNIEVSNVYLSYLREGAWSTPYVVYKRVEAEGIIQSAIANGQAKSEAYRLTPAKDAEKILEEKRQRMAEVRKYLPERKPKEPDWVEKFPVEWKEVLVRAKLKEETEMAKKAVKKTSKAETSEKVGGLFREGSALAYLYGIFEDEKPHSRSKLIADLKKQKFSKSTPQAEWRIRRFYEKGEATGTFAVIRDNEEGTLQLKFGKAGAKKAASKPAKKEAKASKSNSAPKTGKAIKTVASLVRSTLANEPGKWTKNKLVEFLGKKWKVEKENVIAGLKHELKTSGITINEDGVYELA